jgi:hypothetical protein
VALGLTQPLTERSTRNISWGVKAAGAYGTPYHLHVPTVLKSGSLKLLEPSGPVKGMLLTKDASQTMVRYNLNITENYQHTALTNVY